MPIDGGRDDYGALYGRMDAHRIEAIIFEKGVTEKELSSFVELLLAEPVEYSLNRELSERGIVHITLRSTGSGKGVFLKVYNDAVDIVRQTMNDIRMGRLPASAPLKRVVGEMAELVLSDRSVMIGLAMIKDYDGYLYNHSVNVSIIGLSLAGSMGLRKDELELVGTAGLLHDIGKTGIIEQIIKKPGSLSREEWEEVKQHPVLGERIVKHIKGLDHVVGRLVYEHHVRYDHTGYPEHKGELHPFSMIVSVADTYDALTTLRVYQRPYQPADALKILKRLSGTHFDPSVVDSFAHMLGLYPVGTVVRLSTGEVAVVSRLNPEQGERPVVKLIYGRDGNPLKEPVEVDLSVQTGISIAGTAEPATRGFDVGRFFKEEVG